MLTEATEDEALIVARDVRALLCERQNGPPIMTSIGITRFDADEEVTADEVLARASTALYDAKEHGADQARIYTGQTSDALTWVKRIRAALAEDRFVLYSQPIVELRTGVVTHRELLIRMLCRRRRDHPPSGVSPTAERFGLIHEIDHWVTVAALRLGIGRRRRRDQPVRILDRRAADHRGRPRSTRRRTDPSKVIFEITETAAMTNISAARLFAETLNSLGCNVALDDFGTGFASFSYLKHIPARYLKIDMEFVHDLMVNQTDREVVESIIHVARSLNKQTIAEGVEDAANTRQLSNRWEPTTPKDSISESPRDSLPRQRSSAGCMRPDHSPPRPADPARSCGRHSNRAARRRVADGSDRQPQTWFPRRLSHKPPGGLRFLCGRYKVHFRPHQIDRWALALAGTHDLTRSVSCRSSSSHNGFRLCDTLRATQVFHRRG